MQDRYGNEVSTGSRSALDAYVEGVDLFLAAQAGADAAFERAIAEDPYFALAHAALARHHQMYAQPLEAMKAMISARELGAGFTAREQAHIAIIGQLIDGDNAGAYNSILKHTAEYPRDIVILQPCAGVFGLIGFSGRVGREAETFAFFDHLRPELENNWWFDTALAFALIEIGRLGEAEPIIERSYAANPANANAAHYKAHYHYEAGENKAGWDFVRKWLKSYNPESLMHCHISWHEALWALELGHSKSAWETVDTAIRPGKAWGPPINVLNDTAAFLVRAEIAGEPRRNDLWQEIAQYAAIHYPTPGVSFADAHAAIAHAMAGDTEALMTLRETSAGWASDMVNALADIFTAYAESDWQAVVDRLIPIMATHERLGGSRAQRDLLEFTLLHALLRLGKKEEATRLFAIRRPVLAKDGLPPSIMPKEFAR